MEATKTITLRGVRVHNLKNINVEIPMHRLTVVTGVSGAGKSSLVFDTLYAEAQRRYLQTFSTWTRQYLERFDKPDADEISDLPPAIAIRGHRSAATVGALTQIADDLRPLFARAGTIVCPVCNQVVIAHRPADVVAALNAMPAATRCSIAFPIMIRDESDQADTLAALLEEGYLRVQLGAQVFRLGEQAVPPVAAGDRLWVLVDRIETHKTPAERVAESFELAFRRGEGRVGVLTETQQQVFDQRPVCTRCGREFASLEPHLFDDANATLPDVAAVQLGGRNFAAWCMASLGELAGFVESLTLAGEAGRVDQIKRRLQALEALELGHLTLNHFAAELPDGEVKRIALAQALVSDLVNVLYLIDEPTASLRETDVPKVTAALTQLRDRGNTVVVIEHDRRLIAAADHILELGPEAGDEGGNVTYQGPPNGVAAESLIDMPTHRRKPTGTLKVAGFDLPLGVLCVVTGAAGAPLRPLIEQLLTTAKSARARPITDVVLLDQGPLSKSARSNPATYLKIFDEIRTLFAETTDARIRNFGPGHFSFNQPGGRCETCEGQGTLTIDMQFLADVVSTCPECHGRWYRKEILDIKVRSLSIAEVLDLTIREAFRFFRAQAKIEKKLKWLLDVGLDYLRLGQPIETLSGSECQRLKLAGQLASSRKPGVLFVLTEPSAGLHPADVANLLECFDRLLGAGHSLVVVDYDVDVIRCADYVLELTERSGSVSDGGFRDRR